MPGRVDDLNAVNQYALLPGGGGGGTDGPTVRDEFDNDVDAIVAAIADLDGDAASGDSIYSGVLGCAGCHNGGAIGPNTVGTWSRVQDFVATDPALAGYTPEQYVVESIINPSAYLNPDYPNGGMPGNFSDQLTIQDIADLVAYLEQQG